MFANNDLIVVFVGLLSAVALWLFFPAKSIRALSASATRVAASAGQGDERDFAATLRRTSKKIVVFYGSQTGNALGSAAYAVRLAKEFKSRYGLSSLVCDPDNYDFNVLDRIPSDVLVVFVVSTYGEGEPTDNAIGLTEFLKTEELELSNGGNSLENLRYSIFSLGNSTYEQFCKIGKDINNALTRAGATRLGSSGEGDEDKDLEEDYISWKESIWPAVEKTMGWQVGGAFETADFELTECGPEFEQKRVYLGELSERALTGNRGVHDEKNPYVAPVSETRELFQSGERNCVFIDLDISDSGLKYQSGDHVGMWPMNPEVEVERLLRVLGLEKKRRQIIDIVSLDPDLAKVPFPVPTNYETVFRHYIDISQLASRQTVHSFSKFAPTENAKVMLDRFGSDKDFFHSMVVDKGLTLAQVFLLASGDSLEENPKLAAYTTWPIPFERIISRVPVLQPRYYSISSSPKLLPDSIHVTAVVSKTQLPASLKTHYGLHTNYLHSINLANSDSKPDSKAPVYRLDGPRGKYKTWTSYAIPIHTRPSKFRLPTSVKLPVIMIGPGTGIAPFRAFVQERVFLARRAKKAQGPDALKDWGHFHLFYGCRRADSDFLFRDEWAEYAKELDGTFHMHVAFSREVGQPKFYVQDLIEQQSEVIAKAILEKQGYVYICGDAKYMATDVQAKLEVILAKAKGGGEDEGQKVLKLLKEKKRLLLDVWS